MSLEDRLRARQSFGGVKDITVATRGGDLSDLAAGLSRSELGRQLKQLRELVKVKKTRRSPKDPPIFTVSATFAAIERELATLKTYDELKALIILGEQSGGIMRIGRVLRLMALPQGDLPMNTPKSGVDITRQLQRASEKLMRRQVSGVVDDWLDEDDNKADVYWARIRQRGDDAKLMLKLTSDTSTRSLGQRVKSLFSALPRMSASEILGPTSAFVKAGPAMTLLGQPHQRLRPVDTPTRERLATAMKKRGMSGEGGWILAPNSAVQWQRQSTESNPELSPTELAFRLVEGLPLASPPEVMAPSPLSDSPPGRPSPLTHKGRPRKDFLPSMSRIGSQLAIVPKMEPKRAPPRGRSRKSHTSIQNPPPPKEQGRRNAVISHNDEPPEAPPPMKRGSVRRVQTRRADPVDLMSEPVIRRLEATLREELDQEKEAHHDRVF